MCVDESFLCSTRAAKIVKQETICNAERVYGALLRNWKANNVELTGLVRQIPVVRTVRYDVVIKQWIAIEFV